ncbi:heavy metal-associated isoprenylated plant protein 7-like [Cornus florida]|uniref:heavy metal-associated isoprenylated plant protein 7-like n=1 Tax=Cornus florida TaxID=4283 RepID=UPI00289D41F2|nr:heavy metal-associated isoprenylated plant protein 7-like [Cornus florida]
MGEEEKKPAEKKMEEKKPEEEKKPAEGKEEGKSEKPSEEKKEEKKTEDSKETPPPPPPQEVVLRVFMHCEGCARKVRRCLKGFEGVEDVLTDCKTHKVVVKGEKADPLKVLERVQRKSHRQVELLSPIPKPPAEDAKKPEEKEAPKPEEKKEEPQVITVFLKVHMHCEACAQEIKKRILRMKGVENAEPDLKGSQVTVKGVFDPPKLVEYVHKRTGKHAVIVKQEPEKKEEEKATEGKEEKKGEDGDKDGKKGGGGAEEKKEGGGDAAAKPDSAAEEDEKLVDVKKNDFHYYYPQQYQVYPARYAAEMYNQYPPQIFSDENPNACSVM